MSCQVRRIEIVYRSPGSQSIRLWDSTDCYLQWTAGVDGLWLAAWQNSCSVSGFLEQKCGFLSDVDQFVERIVGKLGEVITCTVFNQIGGNKRLGRNFCTLWIHWSRFQKHLSIVNTYFYTFKHNREAEAIGSWTKET